MIARETLKSGTVVVRCRDELAAQSKWLLATLRSMEASGSRFRDGETVQVGWSILTLREKDGELVLCEPDFSHDPLRDVREDVTTTLVVLAQMKDVLARTGASPSFPTFREMLVLAKGVLDDRDVYLHRIATTTPGDSGWFIGRPGDAAPQPSDLDAMPIYALVARRPALLRVLALPVDFIAIVEGDAIKGIADGAGHEVWAR